MCKRITKIICIHKKSAEREVEIVPSTNLSLTQPWHGINLPNCPCTHTHTHTPQSANDNSCYNIFWNENHGQSLPSLCGGGSGRAFTNHHFGNQVPHRSLQQQMLPLSPPNAVDIPAKLKKIFFLLKVKPLWWKVSVRDGLEIRWRVSVVDAFFGSLNAFLKDNVFTRSISKSCFRVRSVEVESNP